MNTPNDPAQPLDVPVYSNVLDAPLFFADTLYHMTWANGVARLSFVANNADVSPDGPAYWEGKHVVTVALPVTSIIAMRDYLSSVVAEWEQVAKQGGQST